MSVFLPSALFNHRRIAGSHQASLRPKAYSGNVYWGSVVQRAAKPLYLQNFSLLKCVCNDCVLKLHFKNWNMLEFPLTFRLCERHSMYENENKKIFPLATHLELVYQGSEVIPLCVALPSC